MAAVDNNNQPPTGGTGTPNGSQQITNSTNSIFEETCKYLGTENTILCRNLSQVLELTKKLVNRYQKPQIDIVPGRFASNNIIMEFKPDKEKINQKVIHLSGKTTKETEERLFQHALRESDLSFKQTNYQIYSMAESNYTPQSIGVTPKTPKRQPKNISVSTPLHARYSTPKQPQIALPIPITTPIHPHQPQPPPTVQINRPSPSIIHPVYSFLCQSFPAVEVNPYWDTLPSKHNVFMVWNFLVYFIHRLELANKPMSGMFIVECVLGFYQDHFAKKIRTLNKSPVTSSKKPKIDFDTLLEFCNFTRENKNTYLDDEKPIFALIYFALRCGKKFLAMKLAETSSDPNIASLFTKNKNQLEIVSKYKKDPFYILLLEVLKGETVDPNSISYLQFFRDWIWHRLHMVKNEEELLKYQQEILAATEGRSEPKIFEILFSAQLFPQAMEYLQANDTNDEPFFAPFLQYLIQNLNK